MELSSLETKELFPNPELKPDLIISLHEIEDFQLDLYLKSGKFLVKKIAEVYRKLLDYWDGPSRLDWWRQEIYNIIIRVIMEASDKLDGKKMKDIYMSNLKFPDGYYIMDELERVLKDEEDLWMCRYPWPAYGFEHISKPKATR